MTATLESLKARLAECAVTEEDCEPAWALERLARDALSLCERQEALLADAEQGLLAHQGAESDCEKCAQLLTNIAALRERP